MIVPVLFGVTVLTFVLIRLTPGDAAQTKLASMGIEPTEQALEMVRERLGLNQSLPTQYAIWLTDVLRLDFGNSIVTNAPVLEELTVRLRPTVELTAISMAVVIIFSFPIGIISAMRSDGLVNRFSRLLSMLVMSIPAFCAGLLFILLFSVKLKWLPTFGYGEVRNIVLPTAALAMGMSAYYARFIRLALMEELSQDYIRAARARGAGVVTLVFSHALKNAFVPILTSLGMSFGFLLGGAAVVERIFSWPGLGKYLIDAILKRDYPVVQCYVLFLGLMFVLINLTVDIVCAYMNPKIRRGGKGKVL